MSYKELAAAGITYGPGGYKCRCCRPKMTKQKIHKKLRKHEKNEVRKLELTLA